MMNKRLLRAVKLPLFASLSLIGYSTIAPADDTEIYQSTFDATSVGRPKVLIVFDDSGSMGTMVEGQRPAYDATEPYAGIHDGSRIYVSTTGDAPEEGSSDSFNASKNRCAESYAGLSNQGFFQSSGVRRWKKRLNKIPPLGRWVSFQKSDDSYPGNPPHVECEEDVVNSNSGNGSIGSGYPKHNIAHGSEYSAATPADSNVNWGSEAYTFYSAHYMDYLYDDSLLVDRSRIEIAQDVVSSIITANTGIDFGLLEFNYNWTGPATDGGRIVHRIIDNMTALDRTNVVNMVNSMSAGGSTPLCESSYEAYRYLAGDSVLWGANRDTSAGRPTGDALPRDTAAESGGDYLSPATDCAYTYVIIMTDGFPQADTQANAAIEALTGETCNNYLDANGDNTKNCLPELAEYMAKTDLDSDTTNGKQLGITYTIGFATDQQLLSDTAAKGKGEYYTADSADELAAAFQGAIFGILSNDSTFTSPAVAVDTFTRTHSRDEVFYAMFKPGESVNWAGNIKKLKLKIESGEAVLVDSADAAAIDASTGGFKDSASTFWSTVDGGSVEKGGVGGLLAVRDPATRTIRSNTGTSGALEIFGSANMTYDAFGLSTDAQLFSLFGVADQGELDIELAFARGFDLDDNGDISTTNREWILADILHSQPLMINYGARAGYTASNPDLRFVVGTNGGFLHMFGNDNGEEDWAFFPKELAPILRERRMDAISADHVYGIDVTPVVYTKDENNDGTIASGDKAWVFFGLRRGGRAMYALDVSNPDSPTYLWDINPLSSGFSEIGQTWSMPVVTQIPGYVDGDGAPKPVIVFGAGYDTNKDNTGTASADSMGRGVFIVDAATGALIWSITPDGNSSTNLQETGLVHSVPGQITALDSNGDELTDRLYFGDAGGQLWRVDLSDNTLPTSSQDTWGIVKLADLNGGSIATDRRLYSAPDVVRIRSNGFPVDAVLIGSGDRANPNATDVDNRFYLIKDRQVLPYTTARPTSSECTGPPLLLDFRCDLPLSDSSLFDITSNVLVDGTEGEKTAARTALYAADGWRLDLTQAGEKSLSKSLTINGKAYFTTFTPDDGTNVNNVCEPEAGRGLLYIVDIYAGGRGLVNLGPVIPDTPSVHFGPDDKIRLLLPPGTPPGGEGDGTDCENGVCDIEELFRNPYGNYWFQEEY